MIKVLISNLNFIKCNIQIVCKIFNLFLINNCEN